MKKVFELNSFSAYQVENPSDAAAFVEKHLLLPATPSLNRAEIVASFMAAQAPLTVVLEADYIDKDWTSLLSLHYSTVFGQYPRHVLRIHLFKGLFDGGEAIFQASAHEADYLGCFTVYPSRPHCIGRTLLDAGRLGLLPGVMHCENDIHLAGQKLKVRSFPFSGQDGKVVCCAHVAMWDIIRYYSTKYGYYGEYYLGDFAQFCEDTRIGRSIPTRGLYWSQILAGFGALRIRPVVYAKGSVHVLADIARGYIRSGIPVILAGKKHAVAGIGLKNPDDENSSMIVNDDNFFPYGMISDSTSQLCRFNMSELDFLFVPLYGKIVVPLETARHMSVQISMNSTWGIASGNVPAGTSHRTFLTSSKSYKEALVNRPNADFFEAFAAATPLPRFVWVTEFVHSSSSHSLVGEYVLDATTSEYDEMPFLMIRYSNGFWYHNRHARSDDDSKVDFWPTPKAPSTWPCFPGNLRGSP